MEVKKRPLTPDHSQQHGLPATKKRIISAAPSSPMLNGSTPRKATPLSKTIPLEEDEDEDMPSDELERFQKEAIYRRMKHYSRQYSQTLERLKAAETSNASREATIAAIETNWTQLLKEIEVLLPAGIDKPSEGSVDIHRLIDSLSLPGDAQPERSHLFHQKLQESAKSTQQIVANFIQIASMNNIPSLDVQLLQNRLRAAEALCAVIKSEMQLLRTQVLRVEADNESLRGKLATEQSNVDRARSETVVFLEERIRKSLGGKTAATEENKEGTPVSTVQPPPIKQEPNGVHKEETPTNEPSNDAAIAEIREKRIEELLSEKVALQNELDQTRLELLSPSENVVKEAAPYKILLGHLVELKTSAEEAREQMLKTQEENEHLRTTRLEWETRLQAESKAKVEEMALGLRKLQSDLQRVRMARDVLSTECHELKTKDDAETLAVKQIESTFSEYKSAIDVLTGEVKRLKARLAARSGDEDLYAFLSGQASENGSYVDHLRKELGAVESRYRALEAVLSSINQSNPDTGKLVQSEAKLRQQYDEVRTRLEKYERLYGSGSGSGLPAEFESLPKLLKEKEEQLKIATMERSQLEAERGAVDSEMNSMFQAFEELDNKTRGNLKNTAILEEKLSKMLSEKNKVDSKYFATMRLKDTIDNERKTLQRNLEKQSKMTAKFTETEKSLQNQLNSTECELSSWKKKCQRLMTTVSEIEAVNNELRLYKHGEEMKVEQLRHEVTDLRAQTEKAKDDGRKHEEQNIKLKKEKEKLANRVLLGGGGGSDGTPRDSQLKTDYDMLMKLLRCSTCQSELRSHVIVKCMHTFCKSCIDARMSTRQRKCPACNLAFGAADVQQMFFQ